MAAINTDEQASKNTDKTLWTKEGKDIDEGYLPMIFVTEKGNIGIKVGGTVIVKPIETWHKAGFLFDNMADLTNSSSDLKHCILYIRRVGEPWKQAKPTIIFNSIKDAKSVALQRLSIVASNRIEFGICPIDIETKIGDILVVKKE